MIDGIKSLHPYLQPETWQRSGLLGMGVTVDMQTGEIMDGVQVAHYKGLRFEIRPSAGNGGYTCLLNGSLHKCYNDGVHNANDFSFPALVDTITGLSANFGLIPAQSSLHGLEVGVNIKLPFSPLRIFKQIVCYRNKPFTQIDKRNKRLGLICCLHDYDVKLYDKQAQSGQPWGHVLRFEVKAKKMRHLRPFHIATLADLMDINRVYGLLDVLTDALQNVVFFDYSIDQKRLSKRELNQYLTLGNSVSWQGMNKYQLTRNRQRLTDLLSKHSRQQLKPLLYGLMVENWKSLFAGYLEAKKLQPFHRPAGQIETPLSATFSHLEYVREIVAGITGKPLQENKQENRDSCKEIYSAKNAQKNCAETAQRQCKNCGRSIASQRPGSVFCSERVYGPSAKACRNRDSNRRRDLKRIVTHAINSQYAIVVTYRIEGKTYTDSISAVDLELTKAWLDRITRIELMPTITGKNPPARAGCRA